MNKYFIPLTNFIVSHQYFGQVIRLLCIQTYQTSIHFQRNPREVMGCQVAFNLVPKLA